MDNLEKTLGNLNLSLASAPTPAPTGYPWWCFWACLGVSCHGATNSLNYCDGAPCYGGTANLVTAKPTPAPVTPAPVTPGCGYYGANIPGTTD